MTKSRQKEMPKKTPIERIFREVAGRNMNLAERHYFLRKRKTKTVKTSG